VAGAKISNARNLRRLLRLGDDQRKGPSSSDNDREPYQPHGHLVWMAGGSLAEVRASDLVCFGEEKKEIESG
jgi:hypothetical protein